VADGVGVAAGMVTCDGGLGVGALTTGARLGDGLGAGVSGSGPITRGVGVGAGCRRKSVASCAAAGALSSAAKPARRRTRRLMWVLNSPRMGGRGVNSR
jgi:hypothetical protein